MIETQVTKIRITMTKLPYLEKVCYAMGDAAANLVWRGALAYLAIFYTDTFGLTAAAAAMLFLVVRLSDGITDIIMGMVADRTETKWGKFRPWVLWSTPILGLSMVLVFTTPDFSYQGKLIYAYATYIALTLAYTLNNVPYSALMGVMTDNDQERTSLSGFRFAGAFLGGLAVMGFTPELVAYFGQGNDAQGYQYTMYLFAAVLVVLMLFTFVATQERVQVNNTNSATLTQELADLAKTLPFILMPLAGMTLFFYYRDLPTAIGLAIVTLFTYIAVKKLIAKPSENLSSSQQDMVDLLTNKPWLILLCIGFLTMMFNGVKYGVIAYYFKYFVANELLAGQYFVALLMVSVLGALSTNYLSKLMGRKSLFIIALVLSGGLTGCMFFIPQGNVFWVFILGCSAEFFAAIMPTLFFSMLGDAADYSEWKNHRRATGLVYSAGTFVQKTGGGFAGALVLLVLSSFGYDGMDINTIDSALPGMQWLMSWIPASFAFAGAVVMVFYPINNTLQQQITEQLSHRRASVSAA